MQALGIERVMQILDRIIPLNGASHADVLSYSVEIPMRYAECFAQLKDGRKVGLADKRRFIGWSGDRKRCSFLFRESSQLFELRRDSASSFAFRANPKGKYVGIDGSLMLQ